MCCFPKSCAGSDGLSCLSVPVLSVYLSCLFPVYPRGARGRENQLVGALGRGKKVYVVCCQPGAVDDFGKGAGGTADVRALNAKNLPPAKSGEVIVMVTPVGLFMYCFIHFSFIIHSFMSFIQFSFIFIHVAFIFSFIHLFIYSCIHSFIHSSMHFFI